MTRLHILLGVAAVLLAVVLWNWISGWGLVTIHAAGQPLSKVIQSIERQGNVKIITNADPSTPVTIDVAKVPPAEAIDTVASWLEANWSVTYVAGASKPEVATAVLSLSDGNAGRNYEYFSGGGGFMSGSLPVAVDPRKMRWNVSPSENGKLQSYLEQFAIKTGAAALVPEEWNPEVTKPPKGGKASSAIRDLISSVKGHVEEIFYLRASGWAGRENGSGPRPVASRPGGPSGGPPGGSSGGPSRGRDRRNVNPEWIAERMEQQIAQLPPEERKQAQAEFDEMREFWNKIRELPESERREAARKFFEDPAVQERMMERQNEREDRRSPERRAERYREYIQRKKAIKQSS